MEPITGAAVSMGCALERPEHPECWLWEGPGGPSQLPEGPMGSGDHLPESLFACAFVHEGTGRLGDSGARY